MRWSPRNCYEVEGGLLVKQYLAGSQRTLGIFKPASEYHATRFADLCIARFWKYRKCSTTRGITDADLNYSLEIANSALADCPEAVIILDSIELFLQQRFQINARPEQLTLQTARELCLRDWQNFKLSAEQLIRLWTAPDPLANALLLRLSGYIQALSGPVGILTAKWIPVSPTPTTSQPEHTTTATPNAESNAVPVTTTGGDGEALPGPVTISPLFSK